MRLHVSVSLDDTVIDDTVVSVTHGVRLGDHDDAVVAFPGADLVLHRDADGFRVRGHRLTDAAPVVLDLGQVDGAALRVVLQPLAPERTSYRPRVPVDGALPILVGAVILLMLGSQAATQAISSKADVSVGVARAVEALLLPPDLRRIEPAAPRTIVIVGDESPYPRPARYIQRVGSDAPSDRPAAVTR